ncbi:glycerate kinase [soil metagenome]
MRILVAPDRFAGTLSAVEAADAIVDGWRRQAPGDELSTLPMSGGGPGFVHALAAHLDGELLAMSVSGPYEVRVPATVLMHRGTAYVEAAQACGLHLTPAAQRDPECATSFGVGELIGAAIDADAERVVVGLGGCAVNDGGAGLLNALGADPGISSGVDLRAGTAGLAALSGGAAIDLTGARRRVGDVALVAASDVEIPLLGLRGATNVFGGRLGIADERKPAVDGLLERLAKATDPAVAGRPGAGAAGGLGFALQLLGGSRRPGVDLVAETVGLAECCAAVDLVLTGEGAFDFSSRAGTVVYGVAQVAGPAVRPCVVLAGRVDVGSREMRALGVEQAYSLTELIGSAAALADPAGSLASLAARVARQWSH